MKQYEIRTKEGKVIEMLPDAWSEREAIAWKNERSIADYVLVFHEFETPAEADKARLDLIESKCSLTHVVCGPGVRKALDLERQAPQPTVRVIATPEGPVDSA